MVSCGLSYKAKHVAGILENIPRSDEDGVSLEALCQLRKRNDRSCLDCITGILTFLKVFDAVSVTTSRRGETSVKAKSEIALYFLRSLARFIRKNLTLTSNWEREGVIQDIAPVGLLSSGVQLLYAMEKVRTEQHSDLTPIRKVFVSQAIIKARLRGRHEPVYLVQYDAKAQRFQLIGGRRRKYESDPLTVMKREIAEELSANSFSYPEDYDLLELVSGLELAALSPTFGAFSLYNFTIYQVMFNCPELILSHNDRWITLSELMSGLTKDKYGTPSDIACKVDALIPGGLRGLKLSLQKVQNRC